MRRLSIPNAELRARIKLILLATGVGMTGACKRANLNLSEMRKRVRARWPLSVAWAIRLFNDGFGIPVHIINTPSRADFARYLLERL